MRNPNNCETCDYKHMKGPDCKSDQHCYMFQDAPDEQCMQHTGLKDRPRAFGCDLSKAPMAIFARTFT